MSDIIYPRSPRETMCGWMHLPRFIDKIRLHLAGKLDHWNAVKEIVTEYQGD